MTNGQPFAYPGGNQAAAVPGVDAQHGYGAGAGYDPNMYQQQAYDPAASYQQAYDPNAYQQQAYDPNVYQQQAYAQSGYQQQAYDPAASYQQQAYDPAASYQQQAYDPYGYQGSANPAGVEEAAPENTGDAEENMVRPQPTWVGELGAWVFPSEAFPDPLTGKTVRTPPQMLNPTTNAWEVMPEQYYEVAFGPAVAAELTVDSQGFGVPESLHSTPVTATQTPAVAPAEGVESYDRGQETAFGFTATEVAPAAHMAVDPFAQRMDHVEAADSAVDLPVVTDNVVYQPGDHLTTTQGFTTLVPPEPEKRDDSGRGKHAADIGFSAPIDEAKAVVPAAVAAQDVAAHQQLADPFAYGYPEDPAGAVPPTDASHFSAGTIGFAQEPDAQAQAAAQTFAQAQAQPLAQAQAEPQGQLQAQLPAQAHSEYAGGLVDQSYVPQQAHADVHVPPAGQGSAAHAPLSIDEELYEEDATMLTMAPIRASLRIDDGSSQPVRGEVIVGRRPKMRPDYPAAELIKVSDPEKSMSKVHVHLKPVDGGILITDLGSTNGTCVVYPDGRRVELRNGQSVVGVADCQIHCGNRFMILNM